MVIAILVWQGVNTNQREGNMAVKTTTWKCGHQTKTWVPGSDYATKNENLCQRCWEKEEMAKEDFFQDTKTFLDKR
jgi:hypothetical protein